MSDFEGSIWANQDNDALQPVCVSKRVKKKVLALDDKGRELRLNEDKLLWRFNANADSPEDWKQAAGRLQATLDNLRGEIDVSLLWETAVDLETSELSELAELYFGGETGAEHQAALWQALADDRTYFKRKGKSWEIRTAEQVSELQTQRMREAERSEFQNAAKSWLERAARNPDEADIENAPATLLERLACWMRGDNDKDLETLLVSIAEQNKQKARETVFDILQKTGHIPVGADRDIVVAGLKAEFSQSQLEAAAAIEAWQPQAGQTVYPLAFSIDDESTREVDDALGIEETADGWLVFIAISDPAAVVRRGDVLDREAMRRGTTVYLPTQSVLMLPEAVSCNLSSLTAGVVRSALLLRVWLDRDGNTLRSEISREAIKLERRLDYAQADSLIAQNDGSNSASQLHALAAVSDKLRAQRMEEGALSFNRPEYKIYVGDEGRVQVEMIDRNSPSRLLVAEMMILANHIAALYARRHQVPVIYRTQEAPLEPIDSSVFDDPMGFQRVRKLLRPSVLSLQPGIHSGLGLSVYTQLTSPLRRFADLVIQRQLDAHLNGEALPYDQEELFKVLATAEQTARESRNLELNAKKRWFMHYLDQQWRDKALQTLVTGSMKSGYRAELLPWGVEVLLSSRNALQEGQLVSTKIEKIRFKAGQIRLVTV